MFLPEFNTFILTPLYNIILDGVCMVHSTLECSARIGLDWIRLDWIELVWFRNHRMDIQTDLW